jgi:hypothetical protein
VSLSVNNVPLRPSIFVICVKFYTKQHARKRVNIHALLISVVVVVQEFVQPHYALECEPEIFLVRDEVHRLRHDLMHDGNYLVLIFNIGRPDAGELIIEQFVHIFITKKYYSIIIMPPSYQRLMLSPCLCSTRHTESFIRYIVSV